ncbi:MAG: anti-sigma regulatory factor [Gemmatirosa sp.]|nr:anti-sigma regulatory factor [Gemmatirosa sp.]
MAVLRAESMPVRTAQDVVLVRQEVRAWAVAQGLGLVDQTKIITAASELARNTVDYGGGGTVRLEALQDGLRKGLRLTFEDQGPGIADIGLALTDGYTTGNGMGLGLSGSKRLVNEFDLWSEPGKGTRVTVTRWK